jgi:phospholipase/carboxylesterase
MAPPDLPLAAVQFELEVLGDTEPPAVFLLHGRRGDERELLPVAQELPEALHVVCFRAPHMLQKSRGLSESDARDIVAGGQGTAAWYEPELSPADVTKPQPRADQLDRSIELVNESVTAAVAAFDLDADRLGLLGFDQGAVVSLACLLEAPEQYDWIVALNGYLPFSYATLIVTRTNLCW